MPKIAYLTSLNFFLPSQLHRKYILTGFALIDLNEFACWKNVYKEVLNSNKLNTSKPWVQWWVTESASRNNCGSLSFVSSLYSRFFLNVILCFNHHPCSSLQPLPFHPDLHAGRSRNDNRLMTSHEWQSLVVCWVTARRVGIAFPPTLHFSFLFLNQKPV